MLVAGAADALFGLACAGLRVSWLSVRPPPGAAATQPTARVDHLIVGVPDLERAIDDLAARTGVRPAIGGSHPGRGTRNALLALGPGVYLEILAPDPAQVSDNPAVGQLRGLDRPTPIGWAVGTDDLDLIKASLAKGGVATTAPKAGGRRMPDGRTLSWRTFGLQGEERDSEPFFIRWDDMASHPSRTSPAGCVVRKLAIAEPEPGRLERLVEALALDVAVERSATAAMRIELDCPAGRVAFP